MFNLKTLAVVPAVAALAFAGLVSTNISASAQATLTNGPEGAQPDTLASKPHTVKRQRYGYRPLTVVRAPAPAPAPYPGVVTGPVSTVVGLPFQILGGIFPYGGPRKGGVTSVRYEGAGAEQAKIDEGFATAVPVDRSGPIYVVENGDPTISPLTFIGAPIAAAGTLVQTPFKIIGATGL